MWDKDFKELGNNYCLVFKLIISEPLFIKLLKSSINVKEKSIRLHLDN